MQVKLLAKLAMTGITLSTLITGCTSTGQPKIDNSKYNIKSKHHQLVGVIDTKNKKLKYITNKDTQGFSINNYSPLYWNTRMSGNFGGILWNRGNFENKKDYYQSVECNANNAGVTVIVNSILFFYYIPWGGGACSKIKYFDYKRFDDDTKNIVKDENIDRKKLLNVFDNLKYTQSLVKSVTSTHNQYLKSINSNYSQIVDKAFPCHNTQECVDNMNKAKHNILRKAAPIMKISKKFDTLKEVQNSKEKSINKKISKINKSLTTIYTTNSTKYNKLQPKLKVKVIDKSGLYKNEKLPYNIDIVLNTIPSKIIDLKSYQNIVDNTLPCDTKDKCFKNFNNAKIKIIAQQKKDIKDITKAKYVKHYKKDIKKVISFINVKNNMPTAKTTITKGYIKKTINYIVQTPKKIKSSKKVVNAKIIVKNMDYTNIFPKYFNSNKDLTISFNNEERTFTLTNLSNNFIQIKSISLYYNSTIYNLSFNRNNDTFSYELPPKAIRTISLFRDIKESRYTNITKSKAKNLTIDFGFAIKYSTGDQNSNKTMYNQNPTTLYKLINNI